MLALQRAPTFDQYCRAAEPLAVRYPHSLVEHGLDVAYVGIDVAFAKRKRLPVAVCQWREGRLVPRRLRGLSIEPPRGRGNAAILDPSIRSQFAEEVADYLQRLSQVLAVGIARIGIDAPSAPCRPDRPRRAAEVAMDRAGISCFATPDRRKFESILDKVRDHLARGGEHSRIPSSNQLWMLVGFELFNRLRVLAPCVEVYPQATARVLGAADTHKFKSEGVRAQLLEASRHTGWPLGREGEPRFEEIAFGPEHDRLDAYLAAWVAALKPEDRLSFGQPPDDVIWTPRIGDGQFVPKRLPREVPEGRTYSRKRSGGVADTSHERLCPACQDFVFKRWPFGWDAHAAHKCRGLVQKEPEERKIEFRDRFGHLFG